MKDMTKSVLKFIGILFALLVLAFTGFQTWNLLYETSQNALVATLGLVLFEGSMIYWWLVFQKEAEGLGQMGLSLLVATFGLFLVGGATALHLGAVGADMLGAQTPARLVTIAAVVNLVAKFLMPLLHPDVFKETTKRAMTGRILARTFKQFEQEIEGIAGDLALELAEDWREAARLEIISRHRTKETAVLPAGPATAKPSEQRTAVHPVAAAATAVDEEPLADTDSARARANGASPHPFGPGRPM